MEDAGDRGWWIRLTERADFRKCLVGMKDADVRSGR